MAARYHHVTMRLEDDLVIGKSIRDARRIARSALERDPDFGLLAFRAADNHLHSLLACGASDAAEYARRVEISTQLALGLESPYAPARVRPVEDQRHLWSAFWYILDQDKRHGLVGDPFSEASNLPDLLDFRGLGSFTRDHVRVHLPRVSEAQVLERRPEFKVEQAPLHAGDASRLADAAAAALALPHLRGNQPESVVARAAAVTVGRTFLRPTDVCRALGLASTSEARLAARPEAPDLERWIEAQLRLRRPIARR